MYLFKRKYWKNEIVRSLSGKTGKKGKEFKKIEITFFFYSVLSLFSSFPIFQVKIYKSEANEDTDGKC